MSTAPSSSEAVASDLERWRALACHTPLALLSDLDGTLIPFKPTPDEVRLDPERAAALRDLTSLPGVTLAIVSGRTRESLERLLSAVPEALLVAEHGGWRRSTGAWQAIAETESRDVDALERDLRKIAARHSGAAVERKTWSVTFHYRRVPLSERDEALVEATAAVDAWLPSRPLFERLDGAEVLEVRPVRMNKSLAVPWVRELVGPAARIVALGDDVTDEDMFRVLGPADEGVRVGRQPGRGSSARWQFAGPDDALGFLRWVASQRREGPTLAPPVIPSPLARPAKTRAQFRSQGYPILAVSNRLPHLRPSGAPGQERKRGVGGLVSALEPALAERGGLWLGWNGHFVSGSESGFVMVDDASSPALAWIDFPRDWYARYYSGLCNSALWPLFHSFPGNVRFSREDWECYGKVNEAFAAAAADLVGTDTPIWVHDYHLLLLASELRKKGHRGPVGHFLHIPFPGVDMFSLFPWAGQLLDAMLDFDLLGFQTPGHVDNFRQCVGALTPAEVSEDVLLHHGRRVRIRDFPIGIVPEDFRNAPPSELTEEITAILSPHSRRRKILGVDRLDYTKGIPERLLAFGRLLELYPEWRSKISFLQVSVPTREDVPEYVEQRARVENVVGRINGEFGEADWVPIRYLYRSYSKDQLAMLYRSADVACVTPLRDGMNLVAKEYVAAQDPEAPGVLVLSSFAGAAHEMKDAILTNPWHVDGMARDLDRALRMPPEERRLRHGRLLATVSKTTAHSWARDFMRTLEACRT